nr:hypothetical protein [Tanacetum cinerariifolium]
MTSFGYRLNPRYAIKECSSYGSLYTKDCSCSKGSVEDKILVPKPPKNYASTNVVNAPREPVVVKQDHGVNPPHIDECCCKCGETLEGIICQRCACKSCGKGAHIGYNCPPKVPIISNPKPSNAQYGHYCTPQALFINPEPGYSQDFNLLKNIHDFQQQYLCCDQCGGPHETFQCQQVISCKPCCENCGGPHKNFQCQPLNYYEPNPIYDSNYSDFDQFGDFYPQQHLCCDNCEGPHETSQCQPMNQDFYNSNSLGSLIVIPFSKRQRFYCWLGDRVSKIKDAFENKQNKPEDIQELFRKLLDDLQNIHEELAEFINSPSWNRPAVYDDNDDDVDYTISITPVLSTKEPDNSLSMRDEHLDTIPTTESDEVIKSSVEDLVSIPSEFKGIPDTMCDVHLVNNPTLLEDKDHFEIVINSNDDYSSSDDDSLYYENIEYVEASPHDSEIVSLEVEKIVIPEDEEIEDDNLCEKLLKINLLIVEIEALKDNPTPSSEFLTKSSSTSPKSILEGTNTFHNSLPEFENFWFDLEEISSGSITTHSVISLPEYEAFSFYDDHIEEISSGSITTHSVISLPEYEAFSFYDDHIKEISSGSTTTQSDISLPEYDSFIFDLSNDQFPPTDRSDFTHEKFGDEPAHIISPPEYDCFYFGNLPDPGELTSSLNFRIRENLSSTTCVNLPVKDDYSPLLAYVVWIFLAYLTYPVIPPHLHSF